MGRTQHIFPRIVPYSPTLEKLSYVFLTNYSSITPPENNDRQVILVLVFFISHGLEMCLSFPKKIFTKTTELRSTTIIEMHGVDL